MDVKKGLLKSMHVYGNFHKYYEFHSATSRMAQIPAGQLYKVWENCGHPSLFAMLDVGCNEGELTVELLNRAREELPPNVRVAIVGVDLDPVLIERCAETWGLNENMLFLAGDFLDQDVLVGNSLGIESFHFVSLFSITMWIHLNHNTEGLVAFLKKAASYCKGTLLVEPQNKKSYQTAAKRCRKLRIQSPHFKIPHQDVDNVDHIIIEALQEFATQGFTNLGNEEVWGRKLILFSAAASSIMAVNIS